MAAGREQPARRRAPLRRGAGIRALCLLCPATMLLRWSTSPGKERQPCLRPPVSSATHPFDCRGVQRRAHYGPATPTCLPRLPQESQAEAYEQCWRKDWQETEAHLLPAKNLSAWIQANLYLSLADAPFDREDPTLNPVAGACVTCPPPQAGITLPCSADVQGDQCLDGPCYQIKINAHIDREVAVRPELIQIENGWRRGKPSRGPEPCSAGTFREIERPDNPRCRAGDPVRSSKARTHRLWQTSRHHP